MLPSSSCTQPHQLSRHTANSASLPQIDEAGYASLIMLKTAREQQQQQQQSEPNYQEIPAYQNTDIVGRPKENFPDLLKGSSNSGQDVSEEADEADDMYAKIDRSKKKQAQQMLQPTHHVNQQQQQDTESASEDSYTQKVIDKFNSYFATGLDQNEDYRVSHC